MQRIGSDLGRHMFTPRVLMDRKPPFKIQSSPNSVGVQKKLIIIFLRVVNISEKNPRKPVPILREEIRDFKLLRHVKLPDTDSTTEVSRYTDHFVQFGRPLSPAQAFWTKSVLCPLSPAHVADTKMWFEKCVKNSKFRKKKKHFEV